MANLTPAGRDLLQDIAAKEVDQAVQDNRHEERSAEDTNDHNTTTDGDLLTASNGLGSGGAGATDTVPGVAISGGA